MTTILGILLGIAVVIIGLQERRIAWMNDLIERLLVANEKFGYATKQLVSINDSVVSAAQDAQRLSVKALEAAKNSNDQAEKAIQAMKDRIPQP